MCVRARHLKNFKISWCCPDNFRKQRDTAFCWDCVEKKLPVKWIPQLDQMSTCWSDLVHLIRNSTFHCVMATLALQQVVCSGIKLSRAQIVSFLGNFPIRASLIPFLFALLPLWMRVFRFPPFGGACHESAEGSVVFASFHRRTHAQ